MSNARKLAKDALEYWQTVSRSTRTVKRQELGAAASEFNRLLLLCERYGSSVKVVPTVWTEDMCDAMDGRDGYLSKLCPVTRLTIDAVVVKFVDCEVALTADQFRIV